MNRFVEYVGVDIAPETAAKILVSVLILVLFYAIKLFASAMIGRQCRDVTRCYFWRRNLNYVYAVLVVLLLGRVWLRAFGSIATFLGLVSAGLAIALHDIIANISAWVFIIARKPFKVGDRIQIGDVAGDVIDIRLFQFSIIEIGNWVDADQSTGRIVHIPNNKVLREHLANFETGFEYIWQEIPVLITFESNWVQAKEILTEIAKTRTEHLSGDAERQIKRAAMQYLIYFQHLTPIVYTSVRESGVLLTIRYIIKPRQRRQSEEDVWEAILTEFAQHDDISLAYPTTRFFRAESR